MHTQEAQIYNIFIITIITISTLVIIGIVLISGIMRKYKRVLNEKIVIEIDAIERERQRIADDLHDEPGTLLASTKILLSTLSLDDEDTKEVVVNSIQCVDEVMVRLNDISRGLTPLLLKKKGLRAAIEDNINFIKNNQFEISFECPDLTEITENDAIQIYRIIQEIIQNTLKHAKAKHLNILVERYAKAFVFLTTDDGNGFTVDEKLKKGRGLELLKRRTSLIGGKLHIKSAIGKGTSYHICVPIKIKNL